MKWNMKAIRATRKKLDLTQKAFAAIIGTTQQMVSEWETGVHSVKNAYSQILTMKFGEPHEESKEDEKSSEDQKAGEESQVV